MQKSFSREKKWIATVYKISSKEVNDLTTVGEVMRNNYNFITWNWIQLNYIFEMIQSFSWMMRDFLEKGKGKDLN